MTIVSLIDVDNLEPNDTRLIHAIRDRDTKLTRSLIKLGSNVNQPNSVGYTPLGEAVTQGSFEIIQDLLEAGADPDCGSESTPLYAAAVQGRIEIAALLIQAGADVNLSSDGETPLMGAAAEGNMNIVQLLIEAGADANARTQDGKSALTRAAENGWQVVFNYLAPLTAHKLRKSAQKQLDKGILYRQRKDNSLVDGFVSAAIEGRTGDVQKAIEQDIDVDTINANGSNALYAAAYWGQAEIAQVLIAAGANLEIQDEQSGWTPLMGAVRMNQYAIVKILLEAGANPNAWSQDHDAYPSLTPLMIAASYCVSIEIFKELIRYKADINAKNKYGNTALMIAASDRHNHKKIKLILSTFLQVGATEEGLKDIRLLIAINDGDLEKVRSLIDAGSDVNARSYTGDTALVVASRKGRTEIVKTLINAGAEINSEGLWHPLISAIIHGHTDVAKLLVQAGADINSKDPQGLSALKCAKEQRNFEIVSLLKEAGALVNRKKSSN